MVRCFNTLLIVILTVLDYALRDLRGIGPARAELLQKELNLFTWGDLLTYFPFRYEDRSKITSIKDVTAEEGGVQLRGSIVQLGIVGQKQSKRLVAVFADNTGSMELVWFKGHNWLQEKLKVGPEYVVYGRPSVFNGRMNMAHPEIELATPQFLADLTPFQPVYSTTEKLRAKGLNSDGIRRLMRLLISQLRPAMITENLSDKIISAHGLMPRYEALKKVHFSSSVEELKAARYRLKFEELFYVQLRLLRLNKVRAATVQGFVFSKVGSLFNDFFKDHLPYELTEAQKRVLREIRADVGSGKQMNRLLQGDVGSGKTMVALMSMLLCADNGFQSCLMAPTEILAQQHYETFVQMLGNLPLNVALLTGSSGSKKRKEILTGLKEGSIHLIIGTHALIEEPVRFLNLGLVVIDEQHRFGVAQRAKLAGKNERPPHLLIMTATPIPRTLAMTLYGDLDTSVIDELPPGRKPIKTIHFTENQRLRMFGFMKEQIALGRQVYVVYPLIQESEKLDYLNLQQGYEGLLQEFPPPQYQISIVHGKLSNEQKEFEMKRFVRNETQIMVATTVIEVGVNVPNASVMIIESAERFGLSQLHQLRGRVGRGAEQSFCILMTGYKLSAETKLRMETMVRTNDGFEISEVDLKLRGPGDIEGTQQSGVVDLKLADLAKDGQILQAARFAASDLLDEDRELMLPENEVYRQQLLEKQKNKPNWSRVG